MNVLQLQNEWSPSPSAILSHDFCLITSETKERFDCPAVKRHCKGFHRIPCRARSLSNNHNIDTAYFEIPFDAPHGLQLHCSHQECIQSGRRFRYCQVCKIPVAKRNFVKRHGHGMIHSARQLRDTIDRVNPCSVIVDVDREPNTDESTSIPTTLSTRTEPSQGLNDISSSENEQDSEDLESLALETLSDSGNKNIITSTTTSIHQLKQNKSDGIKKSFACIDIHPMSNQTVEIPTYNPVPNPLTIHSQGIPQVIPTSPKVQHCPLDMSMIPESLEIPYFDFKSVVFDKSESQITEAEFPLDIDEIDFATIFD